MTETHLKKTQSEIVARRERIRATLQARPCHVESDGTGTHGLVLAAAVRLFAKLEFEECTMKQLAAEAGVHAPALYNHFDSKEQILVEALWLASKGFYEAVLGDLEEERVADWLQLIIRGHARCTLDNEAFALASDLLLHRSALARNLPASDYADLRRVQDEYAHLMRDLIRANAVYEMSQGEGTVAAYAVWTICDHMSRWYRYSGRLTTEDIVEVIGMLVSHMLGAGRSGLHSPSTRKHSDLR